METFIFELPDGRELAFSEAGAADGTPVLAFHGTPGSRRQVLLPLADEAARKAGVRLIAPDRPGYGHSTFQRGRRLVDWAADVASLADHLDLGHFAVIGISGGGPHALVCAALLADRVNRAGVVSGIGPTLSSEDSEDMMRSNQILFALARRSELAVVPLNSLMAELARRRPHQAIKAMRRQLPPSDAAILQRPEIFEAFADDAHRASSTSARASAQDMTLFARPWGFDLTEIAVPVDFWQGDADRNVPASHARLQAAKVPGSTLHEFPGEGHLLCIDRLEEILRAVSR